MNDTLERLAAFGLSVLKESRDELGDLDGGWLQDEAERCGLLERVTVAKPCHPEFCRCAEYDDFPQHCLRYTGDMEKFINGEILDGLLPRL